MSPQPDPFEVDVDRPSPARIYDYLLGGRDNYAEDRKAADQVLAIVPESRESAVQNRAFLRRVVEHLARDRGIRQFLDIGSGLPTRGNVHEIAQQAAPGSRVVYVDNDPLTHNHAVALLRGDPNATFVVGDVREPDRIRAAEAVRQMIDFSEPVGFLCVALMHFIGDEHDPAGLIRALTADAAPGSALALTHLTLEGMPADVLATIERVYGAAPVPLIARPRASIKAMFPWPLVEPGLVYVQHWKDGPSSPVGRLNLDGGIAIKGR